MEGVLLWTTTFRSLSRRPGKRALTDYYFWRVVATLSWAQPLQRFRGGPRSGPGWCALTDYYFWQKDQK